MLEIRNVTKIYQIGDIETKALDNVSLKFRPGEFVSVLGPSGCGKTTLLNIIGGLDRYTEGDLIINGKSTKKFVDSDWDAYRNNSIGFVFQNYNLINHISILENVEMGMTLSGVPFRVRREKAIEVLTKVGLADQMYKRSSQLSGGQKQRVAIARALANDPDVILADEPTGALDTTTSGEVMDLIREISKEKLVVMVTHNEEIAKKYSTRIVQLK
ncbi:MAG: ABC transporter ATP-binding protein, partial [Bacilli bacterium]|nr:ABC transporter ATP-binding protein [Bacilli bacterium]